MENGERTLPWIAPNGTLPHPKTAWPAESEAPGLVAAGADLSVNTLLHAYGQGVFPWFSAGQPILWWSPDPRMVLTVSNFKISRSLQKTLQNFRRAHDCDIRFDTAFHQVIMACAQSKRHGQSHTWIVPAMVEAYTHLHLAGYAHSIETWVRGELVGGLYCVALGRAVFGESMFTRIPDASKIALAALVAFCKQHDVAMVDCQQNTSHLASLGAAEISRDDFIAHITAAQAQHIDHWRFDPLYWNTLLPS
jgi:leucyl/phenylalanyl-tRNA--protein transferase